MVSNQTGFSLEDDGQGRDDDGSSTRPSHDAGFIVCNDPAPGQGQSTGHEPPTKIVTTT